MAKYDIAPIAYSLVPLSFRASQDGAKTDEMVRLKAFKEIAEKYGFEAQLLLRWGVQMAMLYCPKA